jgi:hypothetical protein
MDYSMEDTQNSAPEAQQANKLNTSGQKSDTHSVTKRFVPFSIHKKLLENALY